jgi:hypothetical protein
VLAFVARIAAERANGARPGRLIDEAAGVEDLDLSLGERGSFLRHDAISFVDFAFFAFAALAVALRLESLWESLANSTDV